VVEAAVREGVALDAIWLFAGFLALIVLAAAVLAIRRYLLERGGGTIECGLRCPAGRGGWRLGVVSYQSDELYWYDALGVLLRPEHVFARRMLTVLSRRPPLPSEAGTLGPEQIVVEIRASPPADHPHHGARAAAEGADEHVELAMTEQALTGFLSWLEASPPGSHLKDIALATASSRDIHIHHPERDRGVCPRRSPAGVTRVRRRRPGGGTSLAVTAPAAAAGRRPVRV
jgi:Protein of unknown function (DUF2550)